MSVTSVTMTNHNNPDFPRLRKTIIVFASLGESWSLPPRGSTMFSPALTVSKTTCGLRLKRAAKIFGKKWKKGKNNKKFSQRSDNKEDTCARKLKPYNPSPKLAMSARELGAAYHGFSKGKDVRADIPSHWIMNDVTRFKVINTKDGSELRRRDTENTLVFRKLPREEVLKARMRIVKTKDDTVTSSIERDYDTVKSLEKVANTKVRDRSSIKRVALYERGCNPVYICPGVKVNQAGHGANSEKPQKINDGIWNDMIDMVVSMETLTKPYIDSERLRGLEEAKRTIGWPTLQKTGSGSKRDDRCTDRTPDCPFMWQQIAFGKNVMLNVHTDEDFFLSCLTVLWSKESYSMDDPVVQYFVFPEDGTAVGLRPGDVLLFNSTVPHCASARCNFEYDIYVGSMYLKSALVSGHTNQQRPCDEDELSDCGDLPESLS